MADGGAGGRHDEDAADQDQTAVTGDRSPGVRREVEIAASPDEVWEALSTEEGRKRWLEDDAEREVHVEVVQEPSRLVWWWWRGDEPATRVELLVVAAPAGCRVVVVESHPSFPLVALAAALEMVVA